MTTERLAPAMPFERSPGPLDAAAVWVGLLELDDAPAGPTDLELTQGEAFTKARLLVRESGCVRGFVEVPVADGRVSAASLRAGIARLRPLTRTLQPAGEEPISVVVCTRNRPDDLQRCLATLLRLDYDDCEILVVDSASSTMAVRDHIEDLGSDRVRYLRVDQPGLSRARNAGVRAAANELIAFTDDDVMVDERWLQGISAGFASGPDVACVTGIVATGQLLSRAQRSMDSRLTWARNVEVTRFSLDSPPAAYPLFPFEFGAYGTGGSFASRRSVLFELGGFDEALGIGTPTGGGEDIDWFTRVVLSGHALLYQPDALVWHKHRVSDAELTAQLDDFRVGLGAVLAKLARDPAALRAMLPLVPRGMRHVGRMVWPASLPGDDSNRSQGALRELRAMARGPLALRRARRSATATPLLSHD